MPHSWSVGDLFSIATGLIVLAVGLLADKKNRTQERAAVLLANGIAFGPLLLILASPVPQLLGWQIDLLEITLKEEKLVLWWAAAVATANLYWTLRTDP